LGTKGLPGLGEAFPKGSEGLMFPLRYHAIQGVFV
jgi:hypothetical protein